MHDQRCQELEWVTDLKSYIMCTEGREAIGKRFPKANSRSNGSFNIVLFSLKHPISSN